MILLPITSLAWGVDVSVNNGNVDFQQLKRLGCAFVIIRDGLGWGTSKGTDSMLQRHYENAKVAGLQVGYYHYIWETSVEGIDREADQVLQNLKGKDCDLFAAADIERREHTLLSYSVLNKMAERWRDQMIGNGYRPALYSMGTFLRGFDWDTLPSDLIPWIAHWGKVDKPLYIKRDVFLWQSDVAGTTNESTLKIQLPGVQNAIDINRWCFPE